jgi:protein phosphatase
LDQIALIADIHGNIPALEATLHDIRNRRIKRIFCLGDLVGKGPDSDKVVDICSKECELTLKGNWDEAITSEINSPAIKWHQEKLGPERLTYLENLPHILEFFLSGKKVRLFHASHISLQYRVHMNDQEEKHLAMFTNTGFTGYTIEPDIVGYADIHRIFLKNYSQKILFNVGSVGNPLDQPLAAYMILEGDYGSRKTGAISMNMIRLPYDIELAIKQAREEEMPELAAYENELRTAIYRGRKPLP